jgi:hypothetical protein
MRVINYIEREDTRDSTTENQKIEEKIVDLLEKGPAALVGFPGIGKSATATAIAALYKQGASHEEDHPAIILRMNDSAQEISGKIALIRISGANQPVSIPVINVPAKSDDPELVLKGILAAAKDLQKSLQRVSEGIEHARKYGNLADDTKTLLEQVFELDGQTDLGLDLVQDVMKSLPWINSALGIATALVKYLRNRSFEKGIEKLSQSKPLVIIDDTENMGTNWKILSDLPRLNAKMLYVLGPSTADEYWQFVTDYGNVRRYLQEKQLGQVEYVKVLPLPSEEIFKKIMYSLGTDIEHIRPLFQSTGGVISVAEMLKEVDKLPGGDFDSYFHLIVHYLNAAGYSFAQIKYPPEGESNRVGRSAERIAGAIDTTLKIYHKLVNDNDVYRALCCKREGLSDEVLKRFCFCNRSRNSNMNIDNNPTELELFRMRGCCGKNSDSDEYDRTCRQSLLRSEIVVRHRKRTLTKNQRDGPPFQTEDEVSVKLNESFCHMPSLLKLIQSLEEKYGQFRDDWIAKDLADADRTLNAILDCINKKR